MATTANAYIGLDHYKVRITAGKNVVIADEGEDNGGKNEGANPHQLLLGIIRRMHLCNVAHVRR